MSNVQIKPGGYPVPSSSRVATDQLSILGSGTEEDPLHAAGGGGVLVATYFSDGPNGVAPLLGMPVSVVPGVYDPEASTLVGPSDADSEIVLAAACGVIVEILGPSPTDRIVTPGFKSAIVRIQVTGIVTLTTAQWDQVAVTLGLGLAQGDSYYVDADPEVGRLTSESPQTAGSFVCKVGTALNPRQLLLACPTVPLENPAP